MLLQTRAADSHHPLAVAFVIAPADDAAEQLAIEGFQFSNQALRRLMRETAQRRRRCSRQASDMAFSSASAVPAIGVARCQSVGVVISCGDSGSDS